MNKKAYVRTLEAFFAFFITFMFVILVVSKGETTKPLNNNLDILNNINERSDFRDCIYIRNSTCAKDLIYPLIPTKYDFDIGIDKPLFFSTIKDIRTETLFVSSNQTSIYHTVYLYYWNKR